MSKILNIGCGPMHIPGFINSDKEMDITKTWPYEDEEVDGVVSIHVYQELPARELVKSLMEAYRVLRKGGVLRAGVPIIDTGRPLSLLLNWGNITLFSKSLLSQLFIQIGFSEFKTCEYKMTLSEYPNLVNADNRPEETYYFEAVK